jgi:hypothetical protein
MTAPDTPPPVPSTPPTPPTPLAPDGGSFGRDVRLVVGAILLLGNGLLIYLDASAGAPVTWQNVVLHGGLLLAGLLLMDPRRTIDLLSMVKDKIPMIGKGGGT